VSSLRVTLVLGPTEGGVGRHVRSLASWLSRLGAKVRVAGPAATDQRFGFSSTAEFVTVDPASFSDVWRVRHTLADADVLHVHDHVATRAALAVPRSTPVVVTWHHPVPGRGLGQRVSQLMESVVVRRASVVLGASPDLVDAAFALGAQDARIVRVAAPELPPPTRTRARARAVLGVAGRPLVVALGRLVPSKRFDLLLDAAAALMRRDALPPLILVAGEGPERDRLNDRIRRERLPVLLAGQRGDVPDLLVAADAVVITSDWEARPTVAQEALRAGVPLVATKVGGIPDLVGEAAVLVPPGHPDALAAALVDVLEDPDLAARLRAAGPRQAATWPTEEDTARDMLRIYGEVSGKEI
jgi:glycosyltransferase involved in cell wall biosynthesis